MEALQDLVELLRILGDPTRLRIVAVLRQAELTVGEITRVTGLSQPRVSRHLKLLCDARFLTRTRDQKEVYYRVTVDDDRRHAVQAVFDSLPHDDPELAGDLANLARILSRRQVRARELLSELGVSPLDTDAIREVGTTVDRLLRGRVTGANGDGPLGDLLDVGTGTGSMLKLLGHRARRAVAVDHSREMRLVARARVSLEGLTNCTVQDGDMYSLGLPRQSFDLVTMDRVLGTAERPGDAIEQAAAMLKENGHLLVVETADSRVDEARLGAWVKQAGLTPVEVLPSSRGAVLVALASRAAGEKRVAANAG
ncbi:MAG TPA: metalloregulator ArsR/SmtB family transcription factor [Gammaproteobacteria bacterium]